MRNLLLSLIAAFIFSSTAFAWNDKGHMVVAKLAWNRLTTAERKAAFEILKTHPHYAEFLVADRPNNVGEDVWVFMRAATWPDWIKSHHAESHLSHPNWHYINLPYVPRESSLRESDFPPDATNVVSQIAYVSRMIKEGPSADKPIYLCWLLHLVGDIHQPLHCAALYNEVFPDGDRGATRMLVRVNRGRPQKLHSLWDGLLGKSTSWSSIAGTVTDVVATEADNQLQIDADLRTATTPQSWADEGLASAKKYAYLDGKLAVANSEDDPPTEDVPKVPTNYLKDAGNIAQVAVAKGGHRLASALSAALSP